MTLPQLTPFTASGTYTIPAGCNQIDVILLGGGSGGNGGGSGSTTGYGGPAGTWHAVTLTLGANIPTTTTTIAVAIGAGGAAGAGGVAGGSGVAGGATTATATGMTTLTAAGGAAPPTPAGNGTTNRYGLSPGTEVFNGQSYVGGAQVTTAVAGNAPGGGGYSGTGGLFSGTAGYAGARGEAWFYAYYNPAANVAGSNAFFSMF